MKAQGIDAIWITLAIPHHKWTSGTTFPITKNIDPMYGTLEDFDLLARPGQAARYSHNHGFCDEPHVGPASLVQRVSIFAQQCQTGLVYLAGRKGAESSAEQQPDLNWRDPDVETAMFGVSRWWYKRGVAGFRLEAVDTLFEDPNLRDNPVLPGMNRCGDPNEKEVYNKKLPELHGVLQRLRKVADQSDAVLIGETWTKNIDELKQYYGEHSNELQMPMDFLFTRVDKLSPAEFRKQIAGVNSAGWPVYVLSNHDIVRAYVRYGDGVHNDAIAKLMAGLYLTLRGTPIMHYGEEIGMTNNDPKHLEKFASRFR